MIAHLASLAEKRLILSFAPWTPYYAVLKRIGELFPGPSKVTDPDPDPDADPCPDPSISPNPNPSPKPNPNPTTTLTQLQP